MKKKILVVCRGGNVRSVTIAYVLKYQYGQDALACGWEPNAPETQTMLMDWADIIIIVQAHFKEYIPEKYWDKLRLIDTGEDIWGMSLHPQLLAALAQVNFTEFLQLEPVEDTHNVTEQKATSKKTGVKKAASKKSVAT